MRRVFIVQAQYVWDQATRSHVTKFDFSAAEPFGELTFLLPPEASPLAPGPIIKMLKLKLWDFTSKDFLLLTGNPCLIGWATAVASAACGGQLQVLMWSGNRYTPIKCEL